MQSLMLGVPVKSLDGVVATTSTPGTAYAVPLQPHGRYISYQTVFVGGPSAVQVDIEGSLDNSNWNQLASTTTTTGAIGTVGPIAMPYVRARSVSRTSGTNTSTTLCLA